MVECHDAGKRVEYFKLNQQIHQMIVDAADNPVLASVYSTLMSKVHRARGAANADTLRWAESASEHEAILAALEDPARDGLPAVLREHSENTAREVLAVLERAKRDAPAARIGDLAREEASG
jgi:DNA-binding GntR family transcriptional regulator